MIKPIYFFSVEAFWSSFLAPSLFLSASVSALLLSSVAPSAPSELASWFSALSSDASAGFSGSLTTVGAATVAITKSL